jgi:hypothetical protein
MNTISTNIYNIFDKLTFFNKKNNDNNLFNKDGYCLNIPFSIMENEDIKRILNETVKHIVDVVYNEIYIYIWFICLYNVFLIFIVLANLYLLLKLLNNVKIHSIENKI